LFTHDGEVAMRSTLRSILLVGALGSAGLVLSCGGGNGGGTTDPPVEGTEIRVTVTRDGAGMPGVTVRLFQPGGSTPQSSTTTNANGTAVFGSLTAGSYEVELVVPSDSELPGGEARRPVTVAEGGSASVTYQLVSPPLSGLIEIRLTAGLAFSPSAVTIQAGSTVRWVNDVVMFHTITPSEHTEWSEGTVTAAGDVFEHTFENPGTFPYFCSPHLGAGMTGTITVR
jgi:plastocyanin